MHNYQIINIHGKLYKVKRILKTTSIKMIEGWSDVLRTLYHADIIFKRGEEIYICETIDDINYDPIP